MSNSTVPIKEFRLELSQLTYTGHDLVRPESVLAQSNGTLWTSDGRGGVTRINPDGSQQFLGGLGGNEPNGLAMADDGSLIVANLGLGKVQKLHPDGHAEDLLTEVDGVSITTPNFVFLDSRNRLWISVMTREHHWWTPCRVLCKAEALLRGGAQRILQAEMVSMFSSKGESYACP